MISVPTGNALAFSSLRLQHTESLASRKLAALQPAAESFHADLRADPLFQDPGSSKQSQIAFRTQQIANESADAAEADEPVDLDNESSATRAFLDYMAMSTEERYFEAFLKSKGLSADDFEAMPPKQQQGLLADFREMLKQRMGDASAERIARAARNNWT